MITCSYNLHSRKLVVKPLLVGLWLAGLFFGIAAAHSAEEILPHLMRRLYLQPVSIVGLLVRVSFSLLITVISLMLAKTWIQLPGALTRAFFLSFWIESAILTWSCASGWVVCLLYGGSFLSAASLLWFWLHHACGFRPCAWRDLTLCMVLHCATVLLEFYLCDHYIA